MKPWIESMEQSAGIFAVTNLPWNKREFTDTSKSLRITDLIDIKPYGNVQYIDEELQVTAKNFSGFFFNFSENTDTEEEFRAGRWKFNSEEHQHFSFNNTLGWYSAHFMNRTAEVNHGLSLTRFKPEYYQLAAAIASRIGPFVGAHIRLTDNQFEYPSFEQIEAGMGSLKQGYTQVVVTDEPKNERIWHLRGNGVLVLEDFIEQEFTKEFQELKFTDEVSLGLLSNLVMCHAKDFIGSQGSTFTGYIQRHVGGNMRLFGEQPYQQTGPYTWNGYKYPTFSEETIERNKKINYNAELHEWDNRWWREWPESTLSIKADNA